MSGRVDTDVFEEFGRRYPPGHLVNATSSNTSQLIHALLRVVQPCHVVEIGTWDGATSMWMVRALIENGRGSYTGYEINPKQAEETHRNLERACPGGPWAVKSMNFLDEQYVESDFVFMDHEKTLYGPAMSKLFVPLNGYLLAHDTQAWPASVQFAKNLSVTPGWEILNIHEERGLTIARKVA